MLKKCWLYSAIFDLFRNSRSKRSLIYMKLLKKNIIKTRHNWIKSSKKQICWYWKKLWLKYFPRIPTKEFIFSYLKWSTLASSENFLESIIYSSHEFMSMKIWTWIHHKFYMSNNDVGLIFSSFSHNIQFCGQNHLHIPLDSSEFLSFNQIEIMKWFTFLFREIDPIIQYRQEEK